MISQKQIKEYIPSAVEAFREVMPPVDVPYPEFRIASATTLKKVRAELLEMTGSTNVNVAEPYTSVMETIHGAKGDAVLVYQKYCPEEKAAFEHALWHEMGHFYSTACDKNGFDVYGDQGEHEDKIKETGYRLWTEFVAESISNRVGAKIYPDRVFEEEWRPVYGRIQLSLHNAYNTYPYSFSEYDLAFYFATLLTDPIAIEFLKRASENRLDVMDPFSLFRLPKKYKDPIFELYDFLKEKVAEERFWEIDSDFLDDLGNLMMRLNYMNAYDTVF